MTNWTGRNRLPRDVALFSLLVAIGVLGRWACQSWPNFSPLAATALLAGLLFRGGIAAWLVPPATLALSNLLLPSYDHPLIVATVYGSFLFPVAISRLLPARPGWKSVAVVSALPSAIFFVTTNFAVWAVHPETYAGDLEGLLHCYAMAIPFYRSMLFGDLFFTASLFGVHALATRRAPLFAIASDR